MTYLTIREMKNDTFVNEFESEKEAIESAEFEWGTISDGDKKRTNAFYVLKSVNPDEDADNHFDGDIIKRFK